MLSIDFALALTCSGVSHVCLFSLIMRPSLYFIKAKHTYTFHGSSRRFRMPWLIKSLRSSRLFSAVDRSRGPLMPVLLVFIVIAFIITYRSVLQEVHLVLIDRILSPDALQRLFLYRLDNLRQIFLAGLVVVAHQQMFHFEFERVRLKFNQLYLDQFLLIKDGRSPESDLTAVAWATATRVRRYGIQVGKGRSAVLCRLEPANRSRKYHFNDILLAQRAYLAGRIFKVPAKRFEI